MSVIYQKEITQCPHCKIYPDDWFNDDDEKACCGLVKDEQNLPKDIEGSPYEKVGIPEWCPLKSN